MSADARSDIPFELSTPIGPELHFWRMSGRESLGRLFEYELDLLSETKPDITADEILGKSVTVECLAPEKSSRFFHGLVTNFAQAGLAGKMFRYQATVRPWLWFLTRRSDCRIFQNMSAPDIIKQVFRDAGFSQFKDALRESYREREYCVQYRETHFNFVSRLMEEEGIYYYFQHEANAHSLVLCDASTSHQAIPGYETLMFDPSEESALERDHIHAWRISAELHSGRYVMRDFDYLNPGADLEVQAAVSRKYEHANLEVFDYPGLYTKAPDGDALVKKRLQELGASYAQADGETKARGLTPGATFDLVHHPREDQNGKHLVIAASYQLESEQFTPFGVPKDRPGVHLSFTAIPNDTPYRCPRQTSKPFVQGPQTAIVVGKEGEEIWTDEHGRVKVQFHWDRVGKKDENSSCWIRVASTWAGKGWGMIQLPRIGQEVIVDFLEGDPDQPIITGRVYNALHQSAYKLPADKTQSGVKSRSSKEGDAKTFNELRFEDKKDAEEIYFHAEKNFHRVVENNDTLKVGFDKKDQGDQTIEIHNNQKLIVGNSEAADGSQTIEIWKDRTETVKEGNEKVTIDKGHRDIIVATGNDTHEISKGNREVTIGQGNDTLTVTAGDQSIKITAGKSTTEAGMSIELKVGSSSIKIEPAKITIKAVQIAVEGVADISVSAPMAKVEGSGSLALKGGVVQIN